MDDIYNNITTTGQDGITSTTCAVPQTIPFGDRVPGGADTYTCQFTATVSSNAGSETDTVTAAATDPQGNTVTGQDDATVTINDVQPSLSVDKTAQPTSLAEPGGLVTFTVVVTNTSASTDPVTITSLTDDIHRNLNIQGTCVGAVGTTIQPDGSFSCSFTATVSGNAGYSETDTVTVTGTDDEGNTTMATDSATVNITNVDASITLVKTANPPSVTEPGGYVTFTFTVTTLPMRIA
jgi:hypothetical protein